MTKRKIVHIDMDAFYASVEQLDFPELKNKAIAVGGGAVRGVVAAASYEARKYGVYSAMSGRMAKAKCPHLIFRKPRFERYKEISMQIREIFYRYTNLVEPLALDEAFLDVTENKLELPSATIIAQKIKEDIRNEIGIVASAGISINKFLAKVATDKGKPDGLYVVPPNDVQSFIDRLPIEKFFGVGKKTGEKLKKIGVFVGKDLKKFSNKELVIRFGKFGDFLFDLSNGIDNRLVKPDRSRKSVGAETTFSADSQDYLFIAQELEILAQKVFQRYSSLPKKAKTVVLKVKLADFTLKTRSLTLEKEIEDQNALITPILKLLKEFELEQCAIRLVGVAISNFLEKPDTKPTQLTLRF